MFFDFFFNLPDYLILLSSLSRQLKVNLMSANRTKSPVE